MRSKSLILLVEPRSANLMFSSVCNRSLMFYNRYTYQCIGCVGVRSWLQTFLTIVPKALGSKLGCKQERTPLHGQVCQSADGGNRQKHNLVW